MTEQISVDENWNKVPISPIKIPIIIEKAEYEQLIEENKKLKHENQQLTHDLCCAMQHNEELIVAKDYIKFLENKVTDLGDENVRLKRLDENVKKLIVEIKEILKNPGETNANTSALLQQLNQLENL